MTLAQLQQTFTDHPINAPLQRIDDPLLDEKSVRLFLKREDQLHPHVSGNKWRKLKYNLLYAKEAGYKTLLTYGGAYSNHILATAYAGNLFGFETIGVIRGEAYEPLNPVLARAVEQGMTLHYLNRATYRSKEQPEVQHRLFELFAPYYEIPEGGSNALAVAGCREIVADINIDFDIICCPVGTGGTLAGLVAGLEGKRQALGIAVLKGEAFLHKTVYDLLPSEAKMVQNWSISFDHHFGGYAKKDVVLHEFIERFHRLNGLLLDPVYTGKMLFGLFEMIRDEQIGEGSTVVALHTGNTQLTVEASYFG